MMDKDPTDLLPSGNGLYEKGRRKWMKYHADHPEVWVLFERFALQSSRRRNRYSPWSVGGRVRWEGDFVGDVDYKLSNNHIAYYSRAWMLLDPAVRGRFFATRPMDGEDYPALLSRLGRS